MTIVGIDEVGRGCWAGPLVAGAVLLKLPIAGLRDSKKLSKIQRTALAAKIHASAEVGLGWVGPQEVDTLGLTRAVGLAMERALGQILTTYEQLIIDGNINYFPAYANATAIIKADDSVPAVSAASIVAKVARDEFMANLPDKYAQYGFASHVGYGTPAHKAALEEWGVSDIHRRSYKPIKLLLA